MVKFIKGIIEKLKLRRLNKLGERLTMLLNANAEEITGWMAKMLAAQGWRLIHSSEMDEILEQVDRAEANAAAAVKAVENIKNANASTSSVEAAEILKEFFYGPQGGEE